MKKIIITTIFAFNFLYADFYFINKPKPKRAINENKNSYTIEQFKIEWGDFTPDNEIWEDLDLNGKPDYIDVVANSLIYTLKKFKSIGFEFNDDLKNIPIIIANTNAKYNGYIETLPKERYGGAYYYNDNSFYFILNSIMPTILGQTSQQKNIEVTIAHELMHILQFYLVNKYDYFNNYNDTWFYEASAVFAEEICYPEHNYHTRYIKELYENLNIGIFSNDDYAPYRGVYFLQYLEQKYSDFSIYDLWLDYVQIKDAISTLNKFAISKQTTLTELLSEFYVSIYNVEKYYPNNATIYKEYVSTQNLSDNLAIMSGGCVKNSEKIQFDDNLLLKNGECLLLLGKNGELSSRSDLIEKNFIALNLNQNWNLIANPTKKDVNSSIFQSDKILTYLNGSWIVNPKVISPYIGYWVYLESEKKIYFNSF